MLSFVLDALSAVIIILTLIFAYKKGFLKSIVSFLGIFIILIGSYYSAQIFSPIVYEKTIQPELENYIETKIDDNEIKKILEEENVKASDESDSESTFEKKIAKSILNMDVTKFDLLKIYDESGSNEISSASIIKAMNDGKQNLAAEYIEKYIIGPIVLLGVKSVLFLISFILLSILLKIIFKVSGVLDVIPILNGVNKFLGLFVGIAKSCVYLMIFVLAVNVIIHTSLNSHINISDEVINKTYIFNSIYKIICK